MTAICLKCKLAGIYKMDQFCFLKRLDTEKNTLSTKKMNKNIFIPDNGVWF